MEPPIGIEPMTYALREACSQPAHALAAPIASAMALMAPAALGLSGDSVHEPVHGLKLDPSVAAEFRLLRYASDRLAAELSRGVFGFRWRLSRVADSPARHRLHGWLDGLGDDGDGEDEVGGDDQGAAAAVDAPAGQRQGDGGEGQDACWPSRW